MLAVRLASVILAVLAASPASAAASEELWPLLRAGGHVILMRHTVTTPGVGDPPGFRPGECATQRNLTDAGREDARRIGAAFRARGIPVGRVRSSPWCRCLETARLAFGRAESWDALSNLYGKPGLEPEREATLRATLSEGPSDGNLVLVTHGSTILAITGQHPAPGELFVVTPEGRGRFRLAGRIPVSAIP